MNEQFDTVFNIFVDIYGMPKWETNPKDGQKKAEIIELWSRELKHYTIKQCKEAAYRLCKYRKASTFPTISHIMSELVDEEKEESIDNDSEAQRCYRYILKNSKVPEIFAQRTIYAQYGVCCGGYKPEDDRAA